MNSKQDDDSFKTDNSLKSEGSEVSKISDKNDCVLKQNSNKNNNPDSFQKLKTTVKKLAKTVQEKELNQMRIT